MAGGLLTEGNDLWQTHEFLLELALVQHDTATIATQTAWESTHPPLNVSFYSLGSIAATHGQIQEMQAEFAHSRAESISSGNPDFADLVWIQQAHILDEVGLPAQATAALKQVKSAGAGDPGSYEFFALRNGDPAPAQKLMAAAEKSPDHDTLKNNVLLPQLRAAMALRAHHAAEAIQVLEPARPYQLINYATLYLRAEAEMEAGRYEAAVQDYQLILNNPGIDAISIEYPLSHLKLARVLALEKKSPEAISEYKAFLEAWKDADTDVPILMQARREYAVLTGKSNAGT